MIDGEVLTFGRTVDVDYGFIHLSTDLDVGGADLIQARGGRRTGLLGVAYPGVFSLITRSRRRFP